MWCPLLFPRVYRACALSAENRWGDYLLMSVCWSKKPCWFLLWSVCLFYYSSWISIQCFQNVQTCLLGEPIKLEAFAWGHRDFFTLKIFESGYVFNADEHIYMNSVTSIITYCLSGSGKIHFFSWEKACLLSPVRLLPSKNWCFW